MPTIELTVSNSVTIDASVSTDTDALTFDIGGMRNYSLVITKTGTDGNPLIQIEGSNDGVNWTNPYKFNDDITPFIGELDDAVNSARDQGKWLFKLFRVSTEPNGTTTGDLSMVLQYDLI